MRELGCREEKGPARAHSGPVTGLGWTLGLLTPAPGIFLTVHFFIFLVRGTRHSIKTKFTISFLTKGILFYLWVSQTQTQTDWQPGGVLSQVRYGLGPGPVPAFSGLLVVMKGSSQHLGGGHGGGREGPPSRLCKGSQV